MMSERALKNIVCIGIAYFLLSIFVQAAVAADPDKPENPDIKITGADIDFTNRTLKIQGRNFINGYWPVLKIGDSVLKTVSVSVGMIVAEMPEGIKSGDQVLSVTTGPSAHQQGSYAIKIGPVGQQAVQGDAVRPASKTDGVSTPIPQAIPVSTGPSTTLQTNCGPGQFLIQKDGGWQCGTIAPYPNAIAICAGNDCTISKCGAGFGNCDNITENGCETNIMTDRSHCGGCGTICASSLCISGRCQDPTCSDGIKNGDETDTDCGGGTCAPCAIGLSCNRGADCGSGICSSGVCQSPSCADGVKNGAESDIDCGGGSCPRCEVGYTCNSAPDCTSNLCINGFCQSPTCRDGIKNGSETDIDCGGGACPRCETGHSCSRGQDCTSSICKNDACQPSTCTDGIKNGAETDVDCGGATCTACVNGRGCAANRDCVSGTCANQVCVSGQSF